MKTLTTTALAASLAALPAFAAELSGSTGYALMEDGTTLVVMSDLGADNLGSDEAQSTVTLDEAVSAIAYRPVTGELIAYRAAGDSGDMVYVVDPETGSLADTGVEAGDSTGFGAGSDLQVGFDFNNSLDAARAVNTDGQNNVYFPEGFEGERSNTIAQFTNLAYASDDDNADATPQVFANAYTNAVDGGPVTETLQYVLDAETDSLATLANNEGTLTTVAAVTVDGSEVDMSPMGGMDILSNEVGDNLAVALITVDGAAGLYEVDLDSGAATQIADLGDQGFIGFAAQTGMAQ